MARTVKRKGPATRGAPRGMASEIAKLNKQHRKEIGQTVALAKEVAVLRRSDMEEIAQSAASRVLSDFLGYFDIDPIDKSSVQAFRKDLTHLRAHRESAEFIRKNVRQGSMYLLGTAIVGLVVAFRDAIWNVITHVKLGE